ncbi:hypothetical protein CHU92_04575 [Flavobacterium cyanobacteriorum]|uniref:Ig-like domain-containing protein n=1 Tax=Flavobacterium cyanobacteriorum TaxID=2022802 RepID=A0A255ZGD1_9FLAO|nr:hypothetical protein [Flavobacterium cyanobacteriorum]OYQ39650.1 hypothetical protein CHU92_04575 [Flavobacterium cyanobacteriorum]
MNKLLFIVMLFVGLHSSAQVKIGDNPTTVGTSSALELESTNKALVITRVSNTAAITNPVNGMIIYDISSNCIKAYEDGAWTNCLSNGSNIEPSTNGTAVVSSYNCATGSTGTLSAGVAVSGVTQTITAVVTQLGTYSLNTFANGVVFSASGTFTSLGSQTITLTAIGTPVNTGSNTFTLNTIPNCSFARTTQGNPSSGGTAIVSAYTCSTASAGTLVAGVAVSGVTQTITATVTTVGTYNITATANGVVFTGTGTFAGTGAQTIVLIATGTPTNAGSNSFILNTIPNCSFNRTTISASSGGTAVVSAYNCSGTAIGTMTAGTAVSGVTQVITATVATVGTYSISTTTANGVTFAASGTFAVTGSQNITLTATGTPTTAGINTFTINTTPNCSFTRSTGEVFTSTVCSTSIGTFPSTVTVGSTSVTVNKTTSTDSGSGSTISQCGISPSGSFTSLFNNQSATYTFSVPLKNVQIYGINNESSENTEGYTVTATLAGVAVPIQLVPFGGTCTANFTSTQSGNTGSINNTTTTTGVGLVFNVSSSSQYDTITITRVVSPGGNWHGLMFCNATAVPSTSNGTAVVSSYDCSTGSTGALIINSAVSGVTQTITANVTTPGTYNIATNPVNGVTFGASGTFANAGAQTLVLTATGTPTALGTNAFTLNTIPNCSFNRTTISASSNGTAVVSAYTCNTASAGSLVRGTTVSGVTQTITATVTTVGTYNITATSNGVVFTGTGTFTGTGAQTIVLTATGTPTNAGSNSFTLNTSPNCSFTRTVTDPTSNGTSVVSSYNCSGVQTGRLVVGVPASGVTKVINATVTTIGSYTISTAVVNGITWSASGSFSSTGVQSVTLTASGTPTVAGTNNYSLATTPNCTFSAESFALDYLLASSPTVSLSAGQTVPFTASSSRGITISSGVITLKAGKKYRLYAQLRTNPNVTYPTNDRWMSYRFVNSSNNSISNNGRVVAVNHSSFTSEVAAAGIYTVGSTDEQIRVIVNSGGVIANTYSDAFGSSTLMIEEIPTTLHHLYAQATSSQLGGSNTQINFTQVNASGASISGSSITLRAGKTYRLFAQVVNRQAAVNQQWVSYEFRNSSNVKLPNSSTGLSMGAGNSISSSNCVPAIGVYTVGATDEIVTLRIVNTEGDKGEGIYADTSFSSNVLIVDELPVGRGYLFGIQNTVQSNIANTNTITWANATGENGLSVNTDTITLPQNGTYSLFGSIRLDSASDINSMGYVWTNTSNTSFGNIGLAMPSNNNSGQANVSATAFFTSSTTSFQVQMRAIISSGTRITKTPNNGNPAFLIVRLD